MTPYRKTAIAVGILYIMGTVTGVLSLVFADSSDLSYRMRGLCIMAMGLSLAIIPLLLYPLLKRHNQTLAIAYVVFRGALETAFVLILAFSWFFMVDISRQTALPPGLYAQGQALFSGVFPPIAFSAGALVLYLSFWQSGLVPRWISGWGIIAILLHVATLFLALFGVASAFSPVNTVMNLPIALQEMVMAVYLIARGFNKSALDPAPAR